MIAELGTLLIAVVIVGALLLLLAKAPIDENIKGIARVIIYAVAIILAIRWLIGFAAR
jgi:predicted neutral ceramidase superfamily lipid hydrolase